MTATADFKLPDGSPCADPVDHLATVFTAVMKEWATPHEFAEIVRRNDAHGLNPMICASHDFMDANMAMDEAFQKAFGRACTLPSDVEEGEASEEDAERDMALWNAAWAKAKASWSASAKTSAPALTLLEASVIARDALRAQMAENWSEEEWPETVFWEPYQALCSAINAANGGK